MSKIECFFYTESSDTGKEIVRALCVECKNKRLPPDFSAWFYSGKVGPWTIKCRKCQEEGRPGIIYLPEAAESH